MLLNPDPAEGIGVECGQCGAVSPADKRFCGECGATLPRACTTCGAALEAGKRFCGDCGAPVGAGAATIAAATQPTSAAARAGHRTTVVLGVVLRSRRVHGPLGGRRPRGGTRAADPLLRDGANGDRPLWRQSIEKFIGDAVMAVWGTPVATEEDAERAVRAGLDLVEAVQTLGVEVGRGRSRRRGPAW